MQSTIGFMPSFVINIIDILTQSGYYAVAVGGCVRDFVMGRNPTDFDLASSAQPDAAAALFRAEGYTVVPTGLKHGTITILSEGRPVELTTFRVDGDYTDRRRPEKVSFTDDLSQDLSRRDFTINAMALAADRTIIDPFGGLDDIRRRRIRCVGLPCRRFEEDALRVWRAARFSATLGFDIDECTGAAMHQYAGATIYISRERVCAELCKLAMAHRLDLVLPQFGDLIDTAIPGCGEYWRMHCDKIPIINTLPPQLPLRMAALFARSDVEAYMRTLKFDRATIADTSKIAKTAYNMQNQCWTAVHIKRLLRKIGKYNTIAAARLCLSGLYQSDRQNTVNDVLSQIDDIIRSDDCFDLASLAITGRDLIDIGVSPPQRIGEMLEAALEAVIEGIVDNRREALLAYILTIAASQ